MYKTKVVPAIVKREGKVIQSGYLFDFLSKIKTKTLHNIDGIFMFTGADRHKSYQKQLDGIKKKTNKFNNVRILNAGLQLNTEGEKISASAIRGALMANDVNFIKNYVASNIANNSKMFDDIYKQMKVEIENTYDAQQFEKIMKKDKKNE